MRRVHIGHHFYGAGNFGDDLMLAGFLRAWRQWGGPGQLSCATPFDRACQRRRFPEIAWLPYDRPAREQAVRHCTVWLGLGGPALETDSGPWMAEHLEVELELCRRHRKPMFFLCVGVSNRAALGDPRLRAVLDHAGHVWTRDGATARLLAQAGLAARTTAGGDLAQLCLAEHPWPARLPRALGWLLHFDDPSLLQPRAVVEARRRLADWDHHWLVQEARPLRGSELDTYGSLPAEVRQGLPLHRADYAGSRVEQLLDCWPGCEVVVSSRFHGALIAAWRGARLVVVQRNDKLRGLAETLGCQSLPAARDADALCRAVALSAPVERAILEQEADRGWRCCVGFFRVLGRWRGCRAG